MVEISKQQLQENLKHPEQLMNVCGKTGERLQAEMFSQQIPMERQVWFAKFHPIQPIKQMSAI